MGSQFNRMRRSLFLIVGMVCAVTIPSAKADPTPTPATPAAFPKGTFSLELEASYTNPIRFSTNEFITLSAAGGYYFWDNWSVSLRGEYMHVNQDFGENDADGGGAGVLLRWHVINVDRLSFYIDGGGGLSWFNKAVPTFGTTYNFTARVGPGLSYRISDDVFLLGGARYFHLSNGNQHGRIKNPSYDGIEWYMGVMFTFR